MNKKEIIKNYTSDDVTVVWNSGLCFHSAICVNSLQEVFNPNKRPWIDLGKADKDKIIETVKMCPSGAISIKQKTTEELEIPTCSAEFMENGPIIISGDISMKIDGKITTIDDGKVALCRCGASDKKPYCDGAHRKIKFTS